MPPINWTNPVPDQVPNPFRVLHDAGEQHAGLGGIEVAERKPRDVGVDAYAHVGNGALGRHAQHLGVRKRRHGLDERGDRDTSCQRHQEIRAALSDHVVHQELRAGRQSQASDSTDKREG